MKAAVLSPKLQRERKRYNVAVSCIQRRKRKIYLYISTNL